jgi:hypothetical protein
MKALPLNQLLWFKLILILGLAACDDDFNPAQFDEIELTRLLAADSAKTWILTHGGSDPLMDCELDNQLNLLRTALGDTLGYNKTTGTMLCAGENEGTLEFGLWALQDNAVKDSLVTIVNGDSSFHAIEFITSQTLTLTYQSSNGVQELTYSFVPYP